MTGILNLLAGAVSSVVKDTYFNLVSLLLPGDGTNGAQNNTFLDSSSNNFTITRNGNTTQGTFSPFSQTGWSNYFDGTGDSLTVADNTAFDLGSGAFTVEAWVYYTATNNYGILCGQWGGVAVTGASGWIIRQDNASKFQFVYTTNGTTETSITSSDAFSTNTWNHVVACRDSSNNWALFVNGSRKATSTASATIYNSTYSFSIGGAQNTTDLMTGYVSNVRVVKGSAVYDPTQTTLTVPTAPFTAITNTSFLSCQSNRFIDNSTNAFSITRNGDVSVQAFSPFAPTAAYIAATVGGSGYFDGTGDYLSIADSSAFTLGNSNFCIELWIYPTVNIANYANFIGQWANATTNCAYTFRTSISNAVQFVYTTNGNGQTGTVVDGTALRIGSWNHVVVCRSGVNLAIFQNGTRTATNNISTNTISDSTRDQQIGFGTDGGAITGYMSSLRMVVGSAVYDPTQTTLTIPTAPATNIANTSLLLNFTNAGIIDSTAKNVLETVGNAQISTAVSQFGGSSMYFDGTGDYLKGVYSPNMILSGDFTIECWLYYTAHGSYGGVVSFANSNTANPPTSGWALVFYSTTDKLYFETGTGFSLQTTNTIPSGQWNHVAVVRAGSTITHYLNGTANGSGTSSATFTPLSTDNFVIGVDRGLAGTMTGYIDDLRITKYARYTSNFTAPTTAFPLQ